MLALGIFGILFYITTACYYGYREKARQFKNFAYICAYLVEAGAPQDTAAK
jgi:hypothetical protein